MTTLPVSLLGLAICTYHARTYNRYIQTYIISLDEIFKSSAYLWETVSDPKTGNSGEPGDAPISKALSKGKGFFDYLAQPDQVLRQKRFDMAMRAGHAMLCSATVLQGDIFNYLVSMTKVLIFGM